MSTFKYCIRLQLRTQWSQQRPTDGQTDKKYKIFWKVYTFEHDSYVDSKDERRTKGILSEDLVTTIEFKKDARGRHTGDMGDTKKETRETLETLAT